MSRIRTVKPDLFRHEALFEAEASSKLPLRLAFIGLFTAVDREGRFRWRPRQLKLDVLPFDEVDFTLVLDALHDGGFITRYESAGEEYGAIPSWSLHQIINNRESESKLPDPAECQTLAYASTTRAPRVPHASCTPGPGDHHASCACSRGRGRGRGREWIGDFVSFVGWADQEAEADDSMSVRRHRRRLSRGLARATQGDAARWPNVD